MRGEGNRVNRDWNKLVEMETLTSRPFSFLLSIDWDLGSDDNQHMETETLTSRCGYVYSFWDISFWVRLVGGWGSKRFAVGSRGNV